MKKKLHINSVQSTCTYEVSYMTAFSAKPPTYLIIYIQTYTSSVSWVTHEYNITNLYKQHLYVRLSYRIMPVLGKVNSVYMSNLRYSHS